MNTEPLFDTECDYSWPVSWSDHTTHECSLGERCSAKRFHECWCGATIIKESADG